MFTGIIEEIGIVDQAKQSSSGAKLKIKAKNIVAGLNLGDSIAVNGACLTVADLGDDYFGVDVVRETLGLSTLQKIKTGEKVNLERAMKAEGRFGGHLVSGHVDGMGRIKRLIKRGNAAELEITVPRELMRYVVSKGSIAIDGISLTVAEVMGDGIRIAVIPFTVQNTVLPGKKPGDSVNVEIDMIAKYVEKGNGSKIDEKFLKEVGFAS